MDTILEVMNVDVSYGGSSILHNISLYVKKGEVVSIIGSNGAGKSTLAKTISGLFKPAAGSITFKGKDITGYSPDTINDLGLVQVPEGRGLFPLLKVRENLELKAYAPSSREKMKENLKKTHQIFPILKERKNQRVETMSGGELQQLAVAGGLMGNPEMLILDEPTLGLAPKLVEQIFHYLRMINEEEGIPLLLISQETYRSLQLSQRCYVLENGRIALEGDSRELLNDERVKEAYLGM